MELEKCENAAVFLWLGLPSTLICHENGVFKKRSLNQRNLKSPPFCFIVDGKHFENGSFRKRWHQDIHRISLTEFCLSTNSVFVLRRNVDGKKIDAFFDAKSPFLNSSCEVRMTAWPFISQEKQAPHNYIKGIYIRCILTKK